MEEDPGRAQRFPCIARAEKAARGVGIRRVRPRGARPDGEPPATSTRTNASWPRAPCACVDEQREGEETTLLFSRRCFIILEQYRLYSCYSHSGNDMY